MYPNPTQGAEFTIHFTSFAQGEALLEIFTVTGQRLYTEIRTDLKEGVNNRSVALTTSLTPGMYLVRVNSNGKILTTKMVVK